MVRDKGRSDGSTLTPAHAETGYPTGMRKALITGSVMVSMMMVALDTTIANVALPHMQSSLSASPEQVIWVLTSYLIASAIMTPLSSWLASRYGRRLVMTVSAAAFTLASLACGLATSLPMMVIARIIQGMSGAGLVPLGQATLLDINPPEKQAKAMAMSGLGAMLGPLAGPAIGGWVTDAFSWRWVFLINIPIGILAFIGLAFFMREARDRNVGRFDMFGFATLSIFLAAFQLLLDRGQQLDWFDSREIWIETTAMVLFLYLTLVHMFTASNTFVRAQLFNDRNFSLGCVVSTVIGIVAFATVPIVTVMMQRLLGYSALLTGFVSFPRGVGTVFSLFLVTRYVGRVDARAMLCSGLFLTALSLYLFSRLTLETDEGPLLWAGFLQGVAGGLMIAPLSGLTFSTLAPQFRNEGAAIYALVRNIGASLGMSALQTMSLHNQASVAGRLSEGIRPDNPVLQSASPDFSFDTVQPLLQMSRQIARQAEMVATIDSLWLTCLMALAVLPLPLVMRMRKHGASRAE